MNRILTIALVFTVFALAASAQVGPNAITLSTNKVVAASTNSTAGTGFFVGNQRTVNVLLSTYSTNATSTLSGGDTNGVAGTTSLTMRMAGSFDNVTYFEDGTNWDIVHFPTSTNTTSTYRQLDSTGVQYFRQNRLLLNSTNAVYYPTATYWYK